MNKLSSDLIGCILRYIDVKTAANLKQVEKRYMVIDPYDYVYISSEIVSLYSSYSEMIKNISKFKNIKVIYYCPRGNIINAPANVIMIKCNHDKVDCFGNKLQLDIPLNFWFNQDHRLAIPTAFVPYGEMYIQLQLDNLNNS